ncbi:hypothetical protein hmeg3_16810 [Herbaspirillum sp. meg3]|uniref:hypothetical protein n=1 Tax=Herbaspirillum sp. meg3 TaxID=2025949 RepID=UPI000B980396|nr:hypothetical protein [Herbaspirillum sp. meg3]ASU39777.1 hypothetical protein hmeg3_16810 [Herbaspirillum sp. meg3]
MSDTPSQPPLFAYIIGFALAACCAIWAGSQFALTGSSLGYGVLTGLSFGAMFAFGQRVKNRLFPTPESTKWKINAGPTAADLRPARRAAARAKPMTVAFDEEFIKTSRAGTELESIAWQDINRIVITIGDDFLPMPYWMIATTKGGIRLPNDTPGLEGLMEEFKVKLPGYDNDATYNAVISAMGAMEGTFEVWKKAIPAA